jgi:hypothetical protein
MNPTYNAALCAGAGLIATVHNRGLSIAGRFLTREQ